jgi:hypothetical protein
LWCRRIEAIPCHFGVMTFFRAKIVSPALCVKDESAPKGTVVNSSMSIYHQALHYWFVLLMYFITKLWVYINSSFAEKGEQAHGFWQL